MAVKQHMSTHYYERIYIYTKIIIYAAYLYIGIVYAYSARDTFNSAV